MVLHAGNAFNPAAYVDTERTDAQNRRPDVFRVEAARKNQLRRIDVFDPLQRKCLSGSAVAWRPGIQQVEIRGKPFEVWQRDPIFQTKSLDHGDFPTPAVIRPFVAVKLKPVESTAPAVRRSPCNDIF